MSEVTDNRVVREVPLSMDGIEETRADILRDGTVYIEQQDDEPKVDGDPDAVLLSPVQMRAMLKSWTAYMALKEEA